MEFFNRVLYAQVNIQKLISIGSIYICVFYNESILVHSDDLNIHIGDGTSKESSFTIKNIPLNKGTHIVDLDCMTGAQQSGDQRKKSSETFAIGTSDGISTALTFLPKKSIGWLLQASVTSCTNPAGPSGWSTLTRAPSWRPDGITTARAYWPQERTVSWKFGPEAECSAPLTCKPSAPSTPPSGRRSLLASSTPPGKCWPSSHSPPAARFASKRVVNSFFLLF